MSSMNENNQDWKLKLRYGKLTTPFTHYIDFATGFIGEMLSQDSGYPVGPAIMGIKIWAKDMQDSVDLLYGIADQIGFTITGDIDVAEMPPEQPPETEPYGYDCTFTPFQSDDSTENSSL